MFALPTKKLIFGETPNNEDTGTTSAAGLFPEDIRFSALAPNVLIEPKFGGADMSSLVHSRKSANAIALSASSSGADLFAEV